MICFDLAPALFLRHAPGTLTLGLAYHNSRRPWPRGLPEPGAGTTVTTLPGVQPLCAALWQELLATDMFSGPGTARRT